MSAKSSLYTHHDRERSAQRKETISLHSTRKEAQSITSRPFAFAGPNHAPSKKSNYLSCLKISSRFLLVFWRAPLLLWLRRAFCFFCFVLVARSSKSSPCLLVILYRQLSLYRTSSPDSSMSVSGLLLRLWPSLKRFGYKKLVKKNKEKVEKSSRLFKSSLLWLAFVALSSSASGSFFEESSLLLWLDFNSWVFARREGLLPRCPWRNGSTLRLRNQLKTWSLLSLWN